jgi:cytochrome subunit of sulfide dehydrogenase
VGLLALWAMLAPGLDPGRAQAQDQGPDLRRGRDLAAACTTCHGPEGHSTGGIASLAGVRPEALIEAMQAFRSGQRPATVMQQLAAGYSDAQVALIAAYFASQQARP